MNMAYKRTVYFNGKSLNNICHNSNVLHRYSACKTHTYIHYDIFMYYIFQFLMVSILYAIQLYIIRYVYCTILVLYLNECIHSYYLFNLPYCKTYRALL